MARPGSLIQRWPTIGPTIGVSVANKDRGGKPAKKQAAHTLKEKRQAKKEKKSGSKKAL